MVMELLVHYNKMLSIIEYANILVLLLPQQLVHVYFWSLTVSDQYLSIVVTGRM